MSPGGVQALGGRDSDDIEGDLFALCRMTAIRRSAGDRTICKNAGAHPDVIVSQQARRQMDGQPLQPITPRRSNVTSTTVIRWNRPLARARD
jgi:hypothetical protein